MTAAKGKTYIVALTDVNAGVKSGHVPEQESTT